MKKRLSPAAAGVLTALLAGLSGLPAWAFDSGSTGADGALAPTVDTVIQLPPSGILNYTSINIPQGVTVSFRKNALNTPVHLLVSGNVSIAGRLVVWGFASHDAGTFGDGVLANDGIPGSGGPGGFDGGRGGQEDLAQRAEIIRGGAGLGPGGGLGGVEGPDGCSGYAYYKYYGLGAAHAEVGIAQGARWCSSFPSGSPPRARPYGSPLLQPLMGGSGGGGGRGGTNYAGSGGGGGGGALLLAASGTLSIASTGIISAAGGAAGGADGTGSGGSGGGGSGGAIRLVASAVTGTGGLYAQGGCVAYDSSSGTRQCVTGDSDYGAGGSPGRIRIEGDAITFRGTSSPAYVADTPGPLFLSSVPALRIDTVAGVAVPATPTGSGDVTLPADVANPVTVTFQTTHVPAGNTVLLKVIPAYGTPIEVLSPAITGTTASGTSSVQVNLPQGPSVLQATTTYTVVVAMGEALSRFAGNERVEKVQLVATLGGGGGSGPQARLITVSGKEYLVPAEVLQQVGMPG